MHSSQFKSNLVRRSTLRFSIAIAVLLMVLGAAFSSHAGTFYCNATYGGVIDGFDPKTFNDLSSGNNTLGIDGNCIIKNWPQDNGIGGFPITNINFYFPGGANYYIAFLDVYYPGNMSCNDPTNSNFWIYWAPGGWNNISPKCRQFMEPADVVDKKNPQGQTAATIGVPFTYTITMPLLGQWDQFGNFHIIDNADGTEIRNVYITDDLTDTGAALSFVSATATLVNPDTGVRTDLGTLTPGVSQAWLDTHRVSATQPRLSDDTKHLVFSPENNSSLRSLPAGSNIEISLTVVLDNVPSNVPGTQFTNTARMWFDKVINSDSVNDLQAWHVTTPPMTIVGPDLVVNKTTTATAINVGDRADFTIDAQNSGSSDAWNVRITDNFPTGMCAAVPTAPLSARIVQADGITPVRTLSSGSDYTVAYSGCQFNLIMTDSGGPVAPEQHLLVEYQAQLDPDFTNDGATLTNVAGATQWFSAKSSFSGRGAYDRTLTDGTPNVVDFQDNASVTAALHGYYFEKTVRNLTSQENPATTAAPGDSLHYRLRVFNLDQTINKVTIGDTLNPAFFDLATLRNVTVVPPPGYNATWDFNAASGLLRISGNPVLDVNVGGQLVIEFDITLKQGLANGTIVSNQAHLTADGGFETLSDDPNVNGVASPDVTGDEDPTNVTIMIPGVLAKANTQPTATIGERFDYTVTVPATPTSVPMYDVRIFDTLPANLRFVSARVVSGGAWSLGNTGTGSSLIIEDSTAAGIDVPANGQVTVAITVELVNSDGNQSGVTFSNSASYSYNRANGVDSTQVTGGSGTTGSMTVTEPNLTAAKTVSFASPPGKPITDPAMVGDVLEYRIAIPNNGNSTAFDVNITDTLPANVALAAGSATATINGVAVGGFVEDPYTPYGTTLVWGRANADGSLDIPVGQTLVLTYRVTMVDVSSTDSLTNSAYVDWTSLDEDYPISIENLAPGRERTGAGCPNTILPNDYCTGPASVTIETVDNTSIVKSVHEDSYLEDTSTTPHVVRVGDTVTYDLTLNLQEYTTRNVVVEDTLPAGMALESFTLIGGSNFAYTLRVQPAAGATGTLRWEFGDIVNTPDGVRTNDTLVIRAVAKVVIDAPPVGVGYATSILLENQAKLSYSGGDPALYPGRLTTAVTVDARQPQMSAVSKVDRGTNRIGTGSSADPYQVNISSDVMQFQVKSCNNGLAPAYNIQLSDLLASQLDEAGITVPVVTVGTTVLAAGTDYTYTPPSGRGGTMNFQLHTPVDPGQCVTVDYSIGFHTDLAADQTWANLARLPRYESMPANGRIYSPTDQAQVWMTNKVTVQPVSKTLTSPAEATIGETVTFRIAVPGTPMNTELANVEVSDTLHAALEYVSATATLNGSPLAVTAAQSGQALSWSLGTIPAGQQVVITLTARVANNDQANAGTIVTNTASYTYAAIPADAVTTGSSAPLTIVEPSIAIAKSVTPTAPASAGDILHYTVTLTAASGANFSNAFDAGLVDSLSLGLVYVAGTARLDGVAVEPTVAGDGTTTPQTLAWAANIDIPEGTGVTVTYDVRVADTVVAGQTLTNSVTAQWTGLDGENSFERNGSGVPAYNDYFTGPATTSLNVSDNNSLTKEITADSYVDPPSTAIDKIGRIGDTATYRLTLKLGEGTNRSVRVQDVLPAGMAYDSLVGITPASGGGTFSYSVVSQPAPGATGTLSWDLGDVLNTPSNNNTPFDALIIEYTARVLPDAGIAHVPTTTLSNTATLSYLDANGNTVVDPARLVSGDTLTVRQPIMSPIVKLGNGAVNTAATPLNVNVASETVQFQLRSCNTDGLAPAYSVMFTDVLASQLNEGSITVPVVTVGGITLTAGTDYTYTAPASRGGSMVFVLAKPVNPGQCATIDYSVGFHTDFGPNQTWNNSAVLNEYWSLPAQSGQKYVPTVTAAFHMTNKVGVTPLAKTLMAPVSPAEATIGQEAVYQITVPGTAISGALDNVVVDDTLHGALEFVSATATLNGAPLTLATTQSGQVLSWSLGTIPAGQQAVITLTARVANNAVANAGVSVTNTASYTYTDMPAGAVTSAASAALAIVEPGITLAKAVSNVTTPGGPPKPGDTLRYTVTLRAGSGAAFSNAFDAELVDSLSLGLAYQAGTAKVNGAGNTIADPLLNGDGITTPQTLTWDQAGSTAQVDIAEGATVTVTYDVKVLDTVVAGQVLTNSVTARWTSLDGVNAYERTGVDGIGGLNDYVATAAAPPLTVPIPVVTLQKTVDKPIANPGDRLRYTLVIQNPTGIQVSGMSMEDVLSQLFQQNTIGNVVVPAGAGYTVNGGTLSITGLNIGPNESQTIVFEATLMTSLKSGTVILNQAELSGPWQTPIKSDDPTLPGTADPTRTIIPANGVVYDAATRKPLAGATLTMRLAATGADLPVGCFVDPSQQNQVTPADGTYKFDLNFSQPECSAGGDYLIAVSAVPSKYVAEPSLLIKPAISTAYSVPICSADAIPNTVQCEAHVSATVPTGQVTTYYLNLTLDSTGNQIFNNHIPVDPYVEEKIHIIKTTPLVNVTRGQLVPYTITVKNTLRSTLPALGIVDRVPPGFKYVEGSARVDEMPREPVIAGGQLQWNDVEVGYNQTHTIKLMLLVGSGVTEGKYINQAQVINIDTNNPFSEVAMATVRVIPDPDFDCTDIIGKVFDDANANFQQDSGENGLAGVRLVTARGLMATTDEHGRFHITCAAIPNEDRGSNFVLKLDDRTLPSGYRVTGKNPQVQRATRGKMLRFNFGAAIHHVVSMDISDGVFEPGSTKLRPQWQPRIELLLKELRKAPSVLRLSYLAEIEKKGLVEARIKALKKEINGKWDGGYPLTIETEVFWRRGAPP